ncbi:zinc-binding dehydrogenase [Rubritalea tangerina]|uniref:alcohol dehydrogenase n=1 Tax=Rubritalea tangerina TaxID=430798 RepID=A0ABW4ZAW0_9BACT
MVFQGPNTPHTLDTFPENILLQNGQVLVRIHLATICGSDLHTYAGKRNTFLPSVLGHEAVGVVEAVADPGQRHLLGKRITWTLTDTCGCCKPCTEWNVPQKCESLFKYGHAPLEDQGGLNGCFATHILLRKGTYIEPLPDTLPDEVVAPANCALATMVAVTEPLPPNTHSVLIQGAGLLGIYGATLLKARGVSHITVTDINQERLDFVEKFGFQTLHANHLATKADSSFDAVIEVAGVSNILSEGIRLLRPGGHYLWAGMVHDQTPLDILGVDIVKGCFTVIGVHNYTATHLSKAIKFLEKHLHQYPWSTLVSPPMPLSNIDAAFALSQQHMWHRVAVRPTHAETTNIT